MFPNFDATAMLCLIATIFINVYEFTLGIIKIGSLKLSFFLASTVDLGVCAIISYYFTFSIHKAL